MRVCRTARRGIFRFKLRYCDRGILPSRLLKALASRGFAKRACAQYLCKPGCGVEFALQCGFNPIACKFCSAAWNLSRCETIKFTARLASRRGLLCMQVLRRAINLKCERSQIAGVRLNLKRAIGQISDGAAGFLKFADKF